MPRERCGDFVQALFDLGATVCTPAAPTCGICPWMRDCEGRKRGIARELPRKTAKPVRPLRHGVHFWLIDTEKNVLLRRRPPRGLLGGMTELPTTAWTPAFDPARAIDEAPPLCLAANKTPTWRQLPGRVTHVFTHFPLELVVYAAQVAARTPAPEGMRFLPPQALEQAALPTVMRKVLALAMSGHRRASGR